MLTKSDNETLTRVGPGTPMGTLLRYPLRLTVAGERIELEFSGAPSQLAQGAFNSPLNYTTSHATYPLKCMLTPGVRVVRPEALVGPSFQLSFAAVTAIIAFHEHPRVRGLVLKRDEGHGRKLLRALGALLATGFLR